MATSSSTAPIPSPGATFHLAIPVRDVEEARAFYGGKLGFPKGRESKTWTDYDVFGVCQLVVHEVAGYDAARNHSAVDGDPVPVPHFGAALSGVDFDALVDRLEKHDIAFEQSPHVRFLGQPGEQRTFFFLDPSGNALEFKTMKHPGRLFAKYDVDAFEA
jgi:extradiol dioxygenase family protein